MKRLNARQQAVQHFVLQRVFLGFLQFAVLFRLQALNLGLQLLLDDRRRQDFLFLARADDDLAVDRVRQRIAVRAHRETQPVFAMSWLPHGVKANALSCFSISSAFNATSRLKR